MRGLNVKLTFHPPSQGGRIPPPLSATLSWEPTSVACSRPRSPRSQQPVMDWLIVV